MYSPFRLICRRSCCTSTAVGLLLIFQNARGRIVVRISRVVSGIYSLDNDFARLNGLKPDSLPAARVIARAASLPASRVIAWRQSSLLISRTMNLAYSWYKCDVDVEAYHDFWRILTRTAASASRCWDFLKMRGELSRTSLLGAGWW